MLVIEIPEKFARENRGAVNGIYRFDFGVLADGTFVCSLETAREFKDLIKNIEYLKFREITASDFAQWSYNPSTDTYTEPAVVIASQSRLDRYLVVDIQPKIMPLGTATKFCCYLDTYNFKQNSPYLKVRYLLLTANNEVVTDDTLESTNATVVNNWKTNGDVWLVKRIAQLLNLTAL